jgi:uncharacterized membrane protein
MTPPVATFQGLGDLPGGLQHGAATGLSADGSTVVGFGGSSLGLTSEAFRWRGDTGLQALGCVEGYCGESTDPGLSGIIVSRAAAVSADGGVVAGESSRLVDGSFIGFFNTESALFTWTQDGSFVTHVTGTGRVDGLSADASTLVGERGLWAYRSHAEYIVLDTWIDRGLGAEPIPEQDGGSGTTIPNVPIATSADGARVVGNVGDSSSALAFVWDGEAEIVPIDDPIPFQARGASPDARIVAGCSLASGAPVLWSQALGARELPLPGGATSGDAQAVTFDGRIALGRANDSAWIWENEGPPLALKEWLESVHGLDLGTWQLTSVAGISNDGRTIAGTGVNPDGYTEAWIARLALPVPEPAATPTGVAAAAALYALACRRRRMPASAAIAALAASSAPGSGTSTTPRSVSPPADTTTFSTRPARSPRANSIA